MKSLVKKVLISVLFIIVFIGINGIDAAVSSQSIDLNLTIAEYVSLELPDSINMDVRVNEDKDYQTDVYLRTNCRVTINIESSGFQGDENHLLNNYVQYSLNGINGIQNPSFSYGPIDVSAGTNYSGVLEVNWLGVDFFNEADWQTVTTGDYSDTITVTISY
ncbi:MAG: hypothetical protein ACLFUI_01410 [Halanaerobiales bacterium]